MNAIASKSSKPIKTVVEGALKPTGLHAFLGTQYQANKTTYEIPQSKRAVSPTAFLKKLDRYISRIDLETDIIRYVHSWQKIGCVKGG
jgi:hypothetical protein